ncbi:hypothetical protein [Croceicoccus sp. Ery15]|uniref:hypothetical protein n=1 Tax=Croceicoccus sp. Ery15 TaxID=1703338 RepID=UPI001E49D487|nr:hypothetical protein [Croceicoccus sp. Ery15]
MNLSHSEQMSVLASGTGLALIAVFFGALLLGFNTNYWLPELIACVAGYEFFAFGQSQYRNWKRRRGGPRG